MGKIIINICYFFKVVIFGKAIVGTLLSTFKPTIDTEQKVFKFIRIGMYSKFFDVIALIPTILFNDCFVYLDLIDVSKFPFLPKYEATLIARSIKLRS